MLKGLIFSFSALATLMSIIFLDQPLVEWFSRPENEHIKLAARRITNIGLGENWFAVALIIFVMSTLWPRRTEAAQKFKLRLKNWSVHFFCALLFSGILVHIFKFIFGRLRPHKAPGHDPLIFSPLNFDWHYQSFPSGHTQVLFCSATCFALFFPRFTVLFYILAAALSFTRVMTEQHFLSDVIAGALVGAYGALWSTKVLHHKVARP